MLRDLQARMADALLTPGAPVPADLARPETGAPLDRRFTVHRATVGQSLTGVLKAAFPLTEAILGPRRFADLAGAFAHSRPPVRAWLYAYGEDFPDWLGVQADGRRVPYLADMAGVDWARHAAYFAADADPLDPAALADLPPGREPGDLVFTRHPAAGVRVSRTPIASLAAALADREAGATDPIRLPDRGEALLVHRTADGTVVDVPLSLAEGLVLAALFDGEALGTAATAAGDDADAVDLQGLLARLFHLGVFTAAEIPASSA